MGTERGNESIRSKEGSRYVRGVCGVPRRRGGRPRECREIARSTLLTACLGYSVTETTLSVQLCVTRGTSRGSTPNAHQPQHGLTVDESNRDARGGTARSRGPSVEKSSESSCIFILGCREFAGPRGRTRVVTQQECATRNRRHALAPLVAARAARPGRTASLVTRTRCRVHTPNSHRARAGFAMAAT